MHKPGLFRFTLLLAALTLAGPAFAQKALPAGSYAITGTFSHFAGTGCVLSGSEPITGTLLYPGVGKATTSLVLQSVTPRTTVAIQMFTAFPPVPATGLDGWSGSHFASPNYVGWANGSLKQGGASAHVSFALKNLFTAAPAPSQGTITISAGDCSETLLATLLRIADLPS